MGVHADELERVTRGNRMRTLPLRVLADPRYGGEWDWRRRIDRKTHRRLCGAGWLTSDGEMPDVIADMVVEAVADITHFSDGIHWYLRMARRAIPEEQRERHMRRHLRYARQQGFASYYEYRRAQALEHGHGSLWHMRKDRGWT